MKRIVILLVVCALSIQSVSAFAPVQSDGTDIGGTPMVEPGLVARFDAMASGLDHGWLEAFNGGQFEPTAAGSRAVDIPPLAVQQQIAKMIDNVSAEYLEWWLTQLVGFKSRFYRSPHMLNNATPWLHDVLDGQNRLTASYHNFTEDRGQWGLITMSNVIITLPGVNASSDKVYYMYAHSDSIRHFDIDYNSPGWNAEILNNSPGADDDGSGCAAILEAARVLSRFEFQDTIKFLMVQAEEIGLVGSARYVSKISGEGENVAGGIDYDMVSYGSGNGQYDFDLVWNPASRDLGQHMDDVNDRYEIGLRILTAETTSSIPSDITRFWQAGFPSVYGMEEEFTPYYHTANDTVDTVNFTQLQRATQLAVGTLAEWARMIYVDVGIDDDDITVSNEWPASDDEVEIEVSISNVGNLNATNMKVQFYADGIPFDDTRIWVHANGTNTTNATWTAVEGNHRISVELDPDNEIVETDEANNTAEVYIYVNDRPRAVLTANPMVAMTSQPIAFNGSFSSDDVGGIVEYNFSFGDGNGTGWTTDASAVHAYPMDGIYTATLRVKDSRDAVSDPVTVAVEIVNRPPVANPYSDLTRTLTLTNITFHANASDPDGTVMVEWDLGDGATSQDEVVSHRYAKAGIYEIVLHVEDDDGATGDYPLRVIIDNRDPEAAIEAESTTGSIETEFNFTANASDLDGTIDDYHWDFGDGATADDLLTSHVYARPGTYTVRLTVRDDDGAEARDSLDIVIEDMPPVAMAESSTDLTITLAEVTFNGDESYDLEGAITFMWDLGDGNTSTDMKPKHAYWRPGEYTVTLTVMDSAGQYDDDVLPPITVQNRLPKAEFRTFGNFTVGGTVYFDATGSTDPEGGLTYSWDLGNGTTRTGPVVENVFPGPGTYPVTLTVTDEDGGTDSVTSSVVVKALPPPPMPPKKEEPEENMNLLEDPLSLLLIILVIALFIALIIAIVWGVRRKPKAEEPPPYKPLTITEAPGDTAMGLPPPGESTTVMPPPQPPSPPPPEATPSDAGPGPGPPDGAGEPVPDEGAGAGPDIETIETDPPQ